MTYSKCIYTAACLFLSAAAAQTRSSFSTQSRELGDLHGVVVRTCENAQITSFDGMRVEVVNRQNLDRNHSGDVRWDGMFNIPDVREGVYEVQVMTLQGTILKHTIATVNAMSGSQELRLEIPCTEKPMRGSVSIRRLSHKPLKNAIKALRRAADAQAKGKMAEWEKQLRLATTIDPEYFEARNNLGVFLVRNNRSAEALAEFQAALEIDPSASAVLTNIGACLLVLKQMKEAEGFARRALAIDPLSAQAHYLIGVSMVKQNQLTLEAAGHLRDSASAFPKALEVEAAIRNRIRQQTEE